MRVTHRNGWRRWYTGAGMMLLLTGPLAAQIDLSQLSPDQQARIATALTTTLCTCGCELTVAACLVDDPTCDVSPRMADAIISEIVGTAAPEANPPPVAPVDAGAAADLVSDDGEWYQRLAGQQLVYIYVGSGYRTREQTYLCSDGTFLTNQESGSVTSLGTSASGDNSAGHWAITDDNLTLAFSGGDTVTYTLSLADGTLYLDDWRYFWTDNDRCP